MKIKNTELQIIKGDITSLKVNALVNPANSGMVMEKGLAGVIKQKGGSGIEQEAQSKAPVEPGGAIWTKAGQLEVDCIIHAVSVDKNMRTNEKIIRGAIASAFECAAQLKNEILAMPAVGCGVGGFSAIGAAKIMAQEILKFARFHERPVKEIIVCLYDEPTHQAFTDTIRGYVDHILYDLGMGPYVTVDAIIELPEGIVLIERSNPPYGWALPGGFVDNGESLEQAVVREAREETHLDLEDLRQFHTYSDPKRDPRFHTVSTAFVARGKGTPRFGDDAKGLKVVKYEELLNMEYAFDHKDVIAQYLKRKESC